MAWPRFYTADRLGWLTWHAPCLGIPWASAKEDCGAWRPLAVALWQGDHHSLNLQNKIVLDMSSICCATIGPASIFQGRIPAAWFGTSLPNLGDRRVAAMWSVLGAFVIYLLIKVFLLVVGLGVGFLLHWLIPAINVGMGVLIGVIATGYSLFFFGRLSTLRDADLIEGTEPEPIDRMIYLLGPPPRRRRSKRKPS